MTNTNNTNNNTIAPNRRYISNIFLIIVFSIAHILFSHKTLIVYLNDPAIVEGSNPNATIKGNHSLSSFNEDPLPYRPKLILHVGPPKTGTTSIQCGLAKFADILAQKDHYYFMGTACALQHARYNIKTKTGSEPIKPYRHLFKYIEFHRDPPPIAMDKIEEHHRQNHSIIISGEHFSHVEDSEETLSQLQRIFPPEKWDMHVIVTYRRYYEWIPSMWYQKFSGKSVPDRKAVPVLPDLPRKRWQQYTNTNTTTENIILKEHPTLYSALFYRKKFPVILFDFHQSAEDDGDDLVTNFICHAIPDAQGTCEHIRQFSIAQKEVRVSNKGSIWYLQREAVFRGLLREEDKKKTKDILASKFNAIYNTVNGTKSLPQECLTGKEEKFLFDISYASEKYIMDHPTLFFRVNNKTQPTLFLGKGKDKIRIENELKKQHLDNFAEFKKKGKFCSVDWNKVFEDPEWRKIFREIKRSTI